MYVVLGKITLFLPSSVWTLVWCGSIERTKKLLLPQIVRSLVGFCMEAIGAILGALMKLITLCEQKPTGAMMRSSRRLKRCLKKRLKRLKPQPDLPVRQPVVKNPIIVRFL